MNGLVQSDTLRICDPLLRGLEGSGQAGRDAVAAFAAAVPGWPAGL